MTEQNGVVIREEQGVKLVVAKDETGKELLKMVIEGREALKVPHKDPFKNFMIKSFETLVQQRAEESEEESDT